MVNSLDNANIKNGRESSLRILPSQVVGRAKSAGIPGQRWLAELDGMIRELEEMWHISVGDAMSGGSHAFTAYAEGAHGEKYVLKIDMPENLGGDLPVECQPFG